MVSNLPGSQHTVSKPKGDVSMGIPFARINSAIRRRLLSKEEKAKLERSFFEVVQDGDIVEHFMKSPAWLKIVNPWLEAEIKKAHERLDDVAHEVPQDEVGFTERGRVRLVADLRSMLNEKLKNREVARQKMSELQLTGEKDARPG